MVATVPRYYYSSRSVVGRDILIPAVCLLRVAGVFRVQIKAHRLERLELQRQNYLHPREDIEAAQPAGGQPAAPGAAKPVPAAAWSNISELSGAIPASGKASALTDSPTIQPEPAKANEVGHAAGSDASAVDVSVIDEQAEDKGAARRAFLSAGAHGAGSVYAGSKDSADKTAARRAFLSGGAHGEGSVYARSKDTSNGTAEQAEDKSAARRAFLSGGAHGGGSVKARSVKHEEGEDEVKHEVGEEEEAQDEEEPWVAIDDFEFARSHERERSVGRTYGLVVRCSHGHTNLTAVGWVPQFPARHFVQHGKPIQNDDGLDTRIML